MKEKGLLNDEEFLAWASKGIYQPIPLVGMNFPSVRSPWCELRWKYISNILPKNKSFRILDIGCYLGFFGIMGSIGGHLVDGFDTNEESIYWGNRILKEYQIPNVNIWVSSDDLLANLKAIPSGTYDYVLYLSLHHHMCSKLGVEEANAILKEISRIAPNMIFDMGQSNEVDNGWLTWLRKIPQFTNHREETINWVIGASDYKYGSEIGFTISHEIRRLLFLFIKDASSIDYAPKIISVSKDLGYISVFEGMDVKEYIWRGVGGKGKLYTSKESFPIMDVKSQMTRRYYRAFSNLTNMEYFICEYLYNWLSPRPNYDKASIIYQRGATLAKEKSLEGKIVPPVFLEGNFVGYKYYNWPQLFQVPPNIIIKFSNVVKNILDTAKQIEEVIGVFDFNANNILFNPETGEYLFIDFEDTSGAPNFTKELLHKRMEIFENYFNGEEF